VLQEYYNSVSTCANRREKFVTSTGSLFNSKPLYSMTAKARTGSW
jgi:hypothetical protein